MIKSVAFIGLGNMGAPMAANLVKAGFSVAGFDPSPAALKNAASRGVTPTGSIREAAEEVDAVITMLPNAELVLDVWTELARIGTPARIVIDSSTIDVESARKAHGLLPKCFTVDAPVSGGTTGAEAGTLSFMVGGGADAIEAARPLLEPMAGRIIPSGLAGAGQAAKICNNMLLAISMIGTTEAFVLGERLGLDHQALFNVLSSSSGQCWSVNTYCPVPGPVPSSPANRDYTPGFATALMLKDLRLAAMAAASCNTTTPLGAQAKRLYEEFESQGQGSRDFSSIIEFLRTPDQHP